MLRKIKYVLGILNVYLYSCVSYSAFKAHTRCYIIGPAVPYFSTLSHKRHNFRKKKKLLKMNVCFEFLYKLCLKHFPF